MQKALVEIEIPDGWELADSVARKPKAGEYWLSPNGKTIYVSGVTSVPGVVPCGTIEPRVILRRKWEWPPWLKAKAIAMEDNGYWYAYGDVPTRVERGWCSSGRLMFINPTLADFTPPEVTDWRQSLRINPNCK